MEKCIFCEAVYPLQESDASLKECYCSEKCQNQYEKIMAEHKVYEFS